MISLLHNNVSAKAGVWGNPNDSNQFLVRLYYKSYSRNFFTNFLSYLFLAEKFFPNNGKSSLYSSEFQKFIMVKKIIKGTLSCRWQFLATERLLKMKKKVSKSLHLKSLNPHLKSFFFLKIFKFLSWFGVTIWQHTYCPIYQEEKAIRRWNLLS